MSRPKKCRKVCALPQNPEFLPVNGENGEDPVLLAVDEYETIRLIDREGLSQEECGVYMHIARTSVQQIYAAARKKLADALVEGLPLKIQGGEYRLCDGREADCGFDGCRKRHTCGKISESKSIGGNDMKIAATYENGQIFQHFGHTAQFKIYEIREGKAVSSAVVDTNGSGHGALAGILSGLGVNALICGGIGGGARAALLDAGIAIYGGVCGDADAAVAALLAGELDFNPNASCGHHDHGAEGHSCGNHGCGGHGCHES